MHRRKTKGVCILHALVATHNQCAYSPELFRKRNNFARPKHSKGIYVSLIQAEHRP